MITIVIDLTDVLSIDATSRGRVDVSLDFRRYLETAVVVLLVLLQNTLFTIVDVMTLPLGYLIFVID